MAPSDTGGTPAPSGKQLLRVLMVEDSEEDAILTVYELEKGGYQVIHRRVDTEAAMQAALDEATWDIVLSDHSMPRFSSNQALALVKSRNGDIPFIIVSGSIGEERAVTIMRAGASDYILKDNLKRLVPAIEREIREAIQRRERRITEQSLLAREEQLRIARDIQRRMFPPAPPPIPGFDMAGASQPAEATGGDYYDYIPMANGHLALVVGDVSGHGLGPALLMAETRQCLRALALTSADINDMLIRAGQLLRSDLGDDGFISMLVVELDLGTRTFSYANAGHPPGYLMDAGGRIKSTLAGKSSAISQFTSLNVPPLSPEALATGDVLLLVTDGVLEARSSAGEEFGADRLQKVLQESRANSAERIVTRIFEAVREFTGAEPQADDLTAVVLKLTL